MNAQFLRQKEGPFLLVILLGTSAWLITHTVDRLSARPIVEYRLTEESAADGLEVDCQIENLCVDRCFKNLQFTLAGPPNDDNCFTNESFTIFPPGDAPNEPEMSRRQLSILLPEFHPRWKFEFKAKKIRDFPCRILVSSELDSHGRVADSTEAVEFIPSNLSTFLLRHELEVLSVLVGSSLVLVCLYLYWLNKHSVDESA